MMDQYMYVNCLNKDMQKKIEYLLNEIGIIGENLDRALCSRLVDLEDIIDYSSLV
ncbi:hypothetical protein [Bacillus altitudinis]|uniref:hypothetical protein n=1 Tax=Bacillus altitudinis TaxID=293387 RepID=UPI002F92ACB7